MIGNHKVPYLVQEGYENAVIRFTILHDDYITFTVTVHNNTVTCIEIDKEEKIGITASASGEVIVYDIMNDIQWKPKKHLWDHGDAINHVCIVDSMQLFCTSGYDGLVNLYSFSGNILRTFMQPEGFSVDYVFFLILI